ncbi:MAG: hypothetical protein WCS58_08105 [Candidatus Cloacimonadaceae bacterium]|nr:hypothetical protein [Candidatus Cloacimonadota bacterium]
MNRLLFLVFIVLIALSLTSCGQKNPFAPEGHEDWRIDFYDEITEDDTHPSVYQQKITILGPAEESTLYAFKLCTITDEQSIPTDQDGWALFANDIWTSKNELSMQFDIDGGTLENLISRVVVQVKSADGTIKVLDSAFKSQRLLGTLMETHFGDGDEIGLGAEFLLREQISNIYVEGNYADHFMYRINLLDGDLQQVQTGQWYSTIDLPDIRKVILNANTSPALTANDENSYSQFEVYVVNRNGMEQATPSSMYFRCQANRKPRAVIYEQSTLGLGQYHYSLSNTAYLEEYYQQIPFTGERYPRALWGNGENLEAINSGDFRLHLRWGYHGQYGVIHFGELVFTDDPFASEVNMVLDDATGDFYGSQITAFWLNLDAEPFPVQPGMLHSSVVSDDQGMRWLRVPNLSDAYRHCVVSNLGNGIHTFKLRVEDNQGVLSDVVSQTINLQALKPFSQRSSILIVDNSPNHSVYLPEAVVDAFYNSVVPDTWGNVNEIEVGGNMDPELRPTTMQNYLAVLVHSDNPLSMGAIYEMADALDIYLDNGGTVLFSNTSRLNSQLSDLRYSGNFLSNRFGIGNTSLVSALGANLAQNPFFVEALGQQGLEDIPLNLSDPFNTIVGSRQGLSSVTYFDAALNLDWLYAFGCKSPESPDYPPLQSDYDLYSSKYVGYRHSNNGGTVVVFGFPLSFMDQAATAQGLQDILNDLLAKGQGRK